MIRRALLLVAFAAGMFVASGIWFFASCHQNRAAAVQWEMLHREAHRLRQQADGMQGEQAAREARHIHVGDTVTAGVKE